MVPETEALLMLADRSHHVDTVIRPTLASGQHVVSDRYFGSTLAYQGYGRGLALPPLLAATELALQGCRPDLTIVLDVPVAVAHVRRAPNRSDRFESADTAFHERVRDGFLQLASQFEDEWVVVDGSQSVDDVASDIATHLAAIGWPS